LIVFLYEEYMPGLLHFEVDIKWLLMGYSGPLQKLQERGSSGFVALRGGHICSCIYSEFGHYLEGGYAECAMCSKNSLSWRSESEVEEVAGGGGACVEVKREIFFKLRLKQEVVGAS
jgi:hypothetical protein